MKRFVTYLYEYESGQKSKNAGFIRVDIRGNLSNVEICIRNYLKRDDVGDVFAIVKKDILKGVKIGEVSIQGNQSDVRFTFQIENIMESGYAFADIVGIGICLRNGGYLASCWNDEDVESIGNGAFQIYQKDEVENFIESLEQNVEDTMMQAAAIKEAQFTKAQMEREDEIQIEALTEYAEKNEYLSKEIKTYRKIELDQIHNLPSPNWHLCNNSFLVHGFWGYGYLFLKKEMAQGKERLWLGVPGFFEKPEMVMAMLFGFSEFEAIPQEVVRLQINEESRVYEIEKNQEPKTGFFGCWFVELHE